LELVLIQAHRACVAMLRRATPSEPEHAIALYRAHIKAAGYTVEAGYDH
jgi:hypothetical protein